MSCEQTRLYLNAYLDDELDVADAGRFEGHMTDCAECRTSYRQSMALRSAIRRSDLQFKPSEALTARVEKSIRKASRPGFGLLQNWKPFSVLAGLAIAVFAFLMVAPHRDDGLTQAVVDSHIRSLQPNHLVDVPSSDHHTVKPWFQGKLDFSPPVPDLAAQGWPLEGGRLDYIDGKPVAALVYERRKHQINVFIWPDKQSKEEFFQPRAAQGYQYIHWIKGGMAYWVTSDLNASELLEFAQLLRSQ